MLLHFFPAWEGIPIFSYLRKGLHSKHFAILVAFLTLLSNLFSWEFPIMYAYLALVLLSVLFSEDMQCVIPMVACGYFLFSKVNNPLSIDATSIFLQEGAQAQFWFIAICIAVFLLTRLVFELITKPERRKLPKLTWGFVALGASYLLGGLFTSYYKLDTFFFGSVEILALCFFYFFFYFTLDFTKIDKSYFAYLMMVVGFLLIGEVIGMMYYAGFFTTEGAFSRNELYTGWGHYNNVAGAMIICLPAPFYYATTQKRSWLYIILGNIFFATMLFIQSRGGILFGTIVYAVCGFSTLWNAKNKRAILLTEGIILTLALLVCLVFKEKIINMFMSIIQSGFNDSGRFQIYLNGFGQFLDAPIFGNGFYAIEEFRWGNLEVGQFLPARYHNTYVQLLASCGSVGFFAYVYHRYDTLRMVFKEQNIEKYFLNLCISGLLLTSLLDCHFFNFGPGLTYSILLLLMEIDTLRKPPLLQEIPTPTTELSTPIVEIVEMEQTADEQTETVTEISLEEDAVNDETNIDLT